MTNTTTALNKRFFSAVSLLTETFFANPSPAYVSTFRHVLGGDIKRAITVLDDPPGLSALPSPEFCAVIEALQDITEHPGIDDEPLCPIGFCEQATVIFRLYQAAEEQWGAIIEARTGEAKAKARADSATGLDRVFDLLRGWHIDEALALVADAAEAKHKWATPTIEALIEHSINVIAAPQGKRLQKRNANAALACK